MRKHLPVLRELPTTPGSLGRRELIRWAGAMAAAQALPACSSSSGTHMMQPPPATSFLTTTEQIHGDAARVPTVSAMMPRQEERGECGGQEADEDGHLEPRGPGPVKLGL